MKKIKITPTQEFRIQWLCRFLKENMAYYTFINQLKKRNNINNIYQLKNENMLSLVYRMYLNCSYEDEKYFIELHALWIIFIYEHGLYGKTYTCGKKTLIEYVNDAIFNLDWYCIKNNDTKNKLKVILLKKNEL